MSVPALASPSDQRCWVFVLELAPIADLYLQVLSRFPVQGARVRRIELQSLDLGARLEVETAALAADQAERLRGRLAALIGVRSVGCGWRAPLPEQPGLD